MAVANPPSSSCILLILEADEAVLEELSISAQSVSSGEQPERVKLFEATGIIAVTYRNTAVVQKILEGRSLKLPSGTFRVEPNTHPQTVEVHSIPVTVTLDILRGFFESTDKSGGGKIEHLKYDKIFGVSVITFKDQQVAARLLHSTHPLQLEGASLLVSPWLPRDQRHRDSAADRLLYSTQPLQLEGASQLVSPGLPRGQQYSDSDIPSAPTHIERAYFEIQRRNIQHEPTQLDVERTLENNKFKEMLLKLNVTFYQTSILKINYEDRDLLTALDRIQNVIKGELREIGYKGELKRIGSTIDQLKIKSLDEVDTIFVLDPSKEYTITPSSNADKPHVYQVLKSGNRVKPRELREQFAEHITQILVSLPFSAGLRHHGYNSPAFSGVRYNGPATTLLMTWDTTQGRREISMDITPVLQLPVHDDIRFQTKIKTRCQELYGEMPHYIITSDGVHLFPNPISNQWELTTAQFEADMLSKIPMETPFKMCIKLSKSIAGEIAGAMSIDHLDEQSKEMAMLEMVLNKPELHQTREYMKYGHAFLTPRMSKHFKEMGKKAISINTAAIKHIAFKLASRLPGSFKVKHASEDEREDLISTLMADIFWYLSSGERDVPHFFLDSRISLVSVSTWAAQMYNERLLENKMKAQCLHVAHQLSHGQYELRRPGNCCKYLQTYAVPAAHLDYAEATFKIPAHFDGRNCNKTFQVVLKLAYALGNCLGGVILFYDETTTELQKIKIWRCALKKFCRHHGMLKYINFLGEARYLDLPNMVLHISRFPTPQTLLSYEYNGRAAGHVAHPTEDCKLIPAGGHDIKCRPVLYTITETGQLASDVNAECTDDTNQEGDPSQLLPAQIRTISKYNSGDGSHPIISPKDDTEPDTDTPRDICVPSQASSPTSLISTADKRTEDTSTRRLLKERDRLKWSTNKQDWQQNIEASDIDFDTCVRELLTSKDSFLRVKNPINFVPHKATLLRTYRRHEGFEERLGGIEKALGDTKVLAIAANDWTQNFNHEEEFRKPQHHLLDILAINEPCDGHIWCFVTGSSDSDWEYLMKLGCLAKARLSGNIQSSITTVVNIKCHLIILPDVPTRSSLILEQGSPNLNNILHNLAIALLKKKSTYRDQVGNDTSISLTARQLETVLKSSCSEINLIEGPPGCGKTYIAFHLCSKFDQSQVLYICSTTAFKAYLVYQKICTPQLIESEQQLKKFTKKDNFSNFKCIIIDDAHQLSCSYQTWKLFLLEAKEDHRQVFIFADSKFQNFKSTDLNPLKKCIIDLTGNEEGPFQELKAVHRNSRKVVSFIASCVEHQDPDVGKKLLCSSLVEGDDIELLYIEAPYEDSIDNKLVRLISSMIVQKPDADTLAHYESHDIALLVDSSNPSRDITILKNIFRKQMPNIYVDSASTFPIRGIAIDTIDNFMGVDRQVCVCVNTHKVRRLTPRSLETKRLIRNPQYRAFVSSRGVSRVIFVTDSKIDVKMAGHMKMDRLPKDPRRLWEREAGERIWSVCWLPVDDTAALLYVSGGEVRLVTVGGERLELTIDTSGLRPCHVSSSPDGRTVVFTDWAADTWTVYSRQSALTYVHGQTHKLDGLPRGGCCTPDGGVVILVSKGRSTLRRYELADGRLVWQRSVPSARCLTVDPAGRLYAADDDTVHVYSPDDGGPVTSYTRPSDLSSISALCADTGRRLLAGHLDGEVSLWRDGEVSGPLTGIRAGGDVLGLGLYRDQYLAVGREEGLQLYDVAGALE